MSSSDVKTFPALWMSLSIPTSRTIEDDSTDDGKIWKNATRPCTRTQLGDGFHGAAWSRVIEEPERVLLIYEWITDEALAGFSGFPAHAHQKKALADISGSEIEEEIINMQVTSARSSSYTGITDIYFPVNGIAPDATNLLIDPKLREAVTAIKSLDTGRVLPPFTRRGGKSWVHGIVDWRDNSDDNTVPQQAVVLRWLHFWKSKEHRETYLGQRQNTFTQWQAKLKDLGCLEIRPERHVALKAVQLSVWDEYQADSGREEDDEE